MIATLILIQSVILAALASPTSPERINLPDQSAFAIHDWLKYNSDQKITIISGVMDIGKNNGVTFKLSPAYYAREIDSLALQYFEKGMIECFAYSIGQVFHTIAAMEGDWGNGENKLEHAKKWMGEMIFQEFKFNYPEKYRNLYR